MTISPKKGRWRRQGRVVRWYWVATRGRQGSIPIDDHWGTSSEISSRVRRVLEQGSVVPSTLSVLAPREPIRADVNALLARWLAAEAGRNLADSTIQAKRRVIRSVHRLSLGAELLEHVHSGHVAAYCSERIHRDGVAPMTIRQDLCQLLMAFKWAIDMRLVPRTWELPKAPHLTARLVREKVTPTPAEAWAVADVLSGWRQVLFTIMASTGARVSGAAGLKWSDIDLDARTVSITNKGASRTVAISDSLVEYLSGIRPVDAVGHVLPVKVSTARVELRRTLLGLDWASLGIRRFTSHGLRRMVVQQYIHAGVDIKTAAAQMGHSVTMMLKAYAQVTQSSAARAVNLAGVGERHQRVVNIDQARRMSDKRSDNS